MLGHRAGLAIVKEQRRLSNLQMSECTDVEARAQLEVLQENFPSAVAGTLEETEFTDQMHGYLETP